jgi:NADH dehydrogenase FAD-containing subunit
VGGGAGGCSIAAKYASKLGKNRVIIIDPADVSYVINYITQDYTSEYHRDKNIGFHSSVVEASVLLEYDAVSPHKWFLRF